MRRTLAESSGEYRRVAEHFVRSGAALSRDRFGSSARSVRKSLEVFKLEKIVVPEFERGYRARKREILLAHGVNVAQVPDCTALRSKDDQLGLNEVLLYHGCRAESVESIVAQGFDTARGGERSGRLFGRGTYFADVAAKADTYVSCTAGGGRCLIVAQVCLGKPCICTQAMPSLEHPPEAEPGEDGDRPTFDSVVGEDATHGGVLDHREYVVYSSAQAVPRYLVWYSHTKACNCFRCMAPLSLPTSPQLVGARGAAARAALLGRAGREAVADGGAGTAAAADASPRAAAGEVHVETHGQRGAAAPATSLGAAAASMLTLTPRATPRPAPIREAPGPPPWAEDQLARPQKKGQFKFRTLADLASGSSSGGKGGGGGLSSLQEAKGASPC